MILGRSHRNVVGRPDKRCSRVILLAKLVRTQVHMSSRRCAQPMAFSTLFSKFVSSRSWMLCEIAQRSWSRSFPMILFVWSTVWCSLVIFRMCWLAPVTALNSWPSWLWSRNSSPFPPARLSFFRWMKFVSWGTVSGQIGPICPHRQIWESHGSHFLVLKSFNLFSPNSSQT